MTSRLGKSSHDSTAQASLDRVTERGKWNVLLSTTATNEINLGKSIHDEGYAKQLFKARWEEGSSIAKENALYPRRMECNSGKSIH